MGMGGGEGRGGEGSGCRGDGRGSGGEGKQLTYHQQPSGMEPDRRTLITVCTHPASLAQLQ